MARPPLSRSDLDPVGLRTSRSRSGRCVLGAGEEGLPRSFRPYFTNSFQLPLGRGCIAQPETDEVWTVAWQVGRRLAAR
jgi:hypothetical protein